MDVHAQAWIRACLVGATTAGLIGPHLLAGEGLRNPAQPVRSSAPAPRKPASGAVQPASHVQASNGVTVVQSEVEMQLRQLYERDGREMPDLKLTPAPAAQQVPQGQAYPAPAPVAPRTQQTPQGRYSAAPPAQPPKANSSPNKVTSFFKKMIPGGNKKAQAANMPPRQLPPTPPQPPVYQQPQPNYGQQRYAPQYAPQPVPQVGPVIPQQPAAFIPPAPATTASQVTFGNPAATSAPPYIAPNTSSTNELILLPAPASELDLLPDPSETVAPLIPDSPADEQEFGAPIAVEPGSAESSPVEAAPPKLNDDFPDPFGEAVETQAMPEGEAEETNPFLGKSLDEKEDPAMLSEDEEFQQPITVDEPPADESTAVKMRRIIQRADMKGLKGFCPVTLRDQRELADSKPEFVGSYRGQKFYLASKAAQAKFEEDPARYAPAAYGADVVVLTDVQDVAEGTLDFAAWYKGRLYLFGSQKTHDIFVGDPDRYATPPGIE